MSLESGESKERIIAARMGQAMKTLDSAKLLAQSPGHARSVVNRAYYAAFYALLALLQTIDQTPKKHHGAISIFDREFVKNGIFEKELSAIIHDLFYQRMEDDYVTLGEIPEHDAREAIGKAEAFISSVAKYLKTKHIQSNS